ncbi:ABC transporter permease protein [Methanocella paludicola SANAE]|uniref:ABC transporter permease protein n=1 Tax=Methanocella paludicola (strain DSM 17711 / JCM 13418 / NBRC 101707 / SANAE) TaxID=304371 RepID=D1Z1L1_METPS|nr:ABC transporter permease [Methanocella paludicola]BAI62583.1 ABC transporter permease protein [Methanocella paludicola SANAE]
MTDLPSWRARHIWYRDWEVFKKTAITNILPYFAEPLLFILALGYGLGLFVGEIGGVSYAQFLAPGILASSAMFAASYECTYSTFVRMIFQKTFEAVLCTPVSIEDIVLGEVAWGATKSLISGACIFTVIWALGLAKPESALVIIPVVVLVGFMFASLSIFFTSIVPSMDAFNYYFTLLLSPMFLLSGIFFPLDQLPSFVQGLAWLLPLTHAVNVIRPAALGLYSASFIYDVVWMAAFTLIFYAIAAVLMKRRLKD